MEIKISPSILSADFGNLRHDAIEAVAAGGCAVHIDFMDGHYVHNLSFGLDVIPALKSHVSVPLVAHLEIEAPDRFLRDFAEAGSDMIVVQEDTCPNLPRTIDAIRDLGVEAGIGINPDRNFSRIEAHPHILREIRLLIVMGVYPGFGGQRFAATVEKNISRAVELREEAGVNFDIGVDGGVSTATVPHIVAAGANYLIAGSSIFNGDISKNMAALRESAS